MKSKFRRKGPLCECNCGGHAKPGNRFISGHNTRVKNPMDSPESVEKISGKNSYWYGRTGEAHPSYGKVFPEKSGKNNPMFGLKGTAHPASGKRTKKFCDDRSEYMLSLGCNHPNKTKEARRACSERQLLLGDSHPSKRPETRRKNSESLRALGDSHPSKRLKFCKRVSEYLLSLGDNHPSKRPEVCEKKSKTMKAKGEDHSSKRPKVRKQISETLKAMGDNHSSKRLKFRKARSEYMSNGGAAYLNSFIQNPSKPQVQLFNITKQLYPQAILNYPSLNKSIDIAIPNLMIAIEYDGSYWHKDQVADNKRQKELENIGWQFLRYKDCVPVIDELKNDLKTAADTKEHCTGRGGKFEEAEK